MLRQTFSKNEEVGLPSFDDEDATPSTQIPPTSPVSENRKTPLTPKQIVEDEKKRLGYRYNANRHLMHLCFIGDIEMVKYVVESDTTVNINYITTEYHSKHIKPGDTPISIARDMGNDDIILYLEEKGFREWKSSGPMLQYFQQLIEQGPKS